MANFDFDQAEGLRRMLAGPEPRIVTFLSATLQDDKSAMLINLCASLACTGNDVLLVDAGASADGVAVRLGVTAGATVLDAARHGCELNQVIHPVPQGFGVVSLMPRRRRGAPAVVAPAEAQRLAKTFDILTKQTGIVIVDGEFDDAGFPLPVMGSAEIVVQVSNSATSIKDAYCLIKHLNQELGRRPFGILVTGASEAEAKVVYNNMAQAASRYLAVNLISMGSVPADEYLHRAARLGRAVIDAFPLAGASVAFRQLAGRFTRPGLPSTHRAGSGNHFGA